MRIAEAASRSGLSIDTIRYYEKTDMLPEIARGPDGQRRFSSENVEWLSLLSSLRDTGMPVKTMRRFAALYRAGDHTIAERREILLAHAGQLKERRAALERCEALLAYKLSIYEEGNALKLMQWDSKAPVSDGGAPGTGKAERKAMRRKR